MSLRRAFFATKQSYPIALLQNADLRHSEEWNDEESRREEILRSAQNDRKMLFRNSPLMKDFPDIINLIRMNEVNVRDEKFKELCLKFGDAQIYQKILEIIS